MPIEIHPLALKTLRTFPADVLVQAKEAFAFLERGSAPSMPLSRPMPSIWKGCHELRIKDRQGNFRIFYVFVARDIIYVPHCFQKKTQETLIRDIHSAQRRIKDFIA